MLKEPGTERALIATILKHGKDAYIDCSDIVSSDDFSFPLNKAIYNCISNLADDEKCNGFDIETVKLKARTLGNIDLKDRKTVEYLELLGDSPTEKNNVRMFAMQVKKCSVSRDLYDRFIKGAKYLEELSADKTLSEIISSSESIVLDFIAGTQDSDSLQLIGDKIQDHINYLLKKEPVDIVGIPTNFPIWDRAIGGGQRGGAVNIVGARSKVGKSWHAINVAINVALLGIPVLYLDSELNLSMQQDRIVPILSGCPISKFETGQFQTDKEMVARVLNVGNTISKMPLTYQAINGMNGSEALAYARRWLIKNVGLKSNGHANSCLIIYDYFKLTDNKDLTSYNPEYIAVGFLLGQMHNFCHKYNIPMLGYVQLNRDGIDSNDTSAVSQSDRILWLCSSLSYLRNKDQIDSEMQCGFQYGNKKMLVVDTRFGSGLPSESDYINIHGSMRPNITEQTGTGAMREGLLFSSITGKNS